MGFISEDSSHHRIHRLIDRRFVAQFDERFAGEFEDPQGRVIVDNACRTNVPGLFAAGDVTNNYAEQVLIAVGEGAKAALSAYEYLLPKLEYSQG